MEKSRILVLGGGFVGQKVARAFDAAGASVQLLTRTVSASLRAELDDTGVSLDEADIATAGDRLAQAVGETDAVVYCAGGLLPAESNADVHADVTLSLHPLLTTLTAMREQPGARLVFLSSGGTVYGVPRELPVAEDHPTDPITSYGILKLASEKYISMYSRLWGVEADILRCANIYGPGQPGGRSQGVLGSFLTRIAGGEPLTIYGSGEVLRDFVHVDDVVAVIRRVLELPPLPETRVLNVGTGVGTSINDVVRILRDRIGSFDVERVAKRSFDVPAIVLDITQLRESIAFSPCSIEDGIDDLLVRYGLGPRQAVAIRSSVAP